MLLILTSCLGGVFILEQPGGSILEFYPTFRWALARIVDIFGLQSELASVDHFSFNIISHVEKLPVHLWMPSNICADTIGPGCPNKLDDGHLWLTNIKTTVCLLQLTYHQKGTAVRTHNHACEEEPHEGGNRPCI